MNGMMVMKMIHYVVHSESVTIDTQEQDCMIIWFYTDPGCGSAFLDLKISNEFMIVDMKMAESSDWGMSGRLAACVKDFVFEMIPRTETSIMNTSAGTWVKQGSRCVLISRYLFSLYSFDFSRLDLWHAVSSNTSTRASSWMTMSGRTDDWKTRSMGLKQDEGRSRRRHWLADLW